MRFALSFSRLSFLAAASLTTLTAATDTIAVLPLFNQNKTPNMDWIGESVAETLRESLASEGVMALPREDRLEVYRRLSVRPDAQLTRATVMRIGEGLDASQLLFGHFEFTPAAAAGDKSALRLIVEVIDLKRLRNGPHFSEDGPLEDLSLMQSRLCWQALKYFQPRTTAPEEDYLRGRPPVRIDAVENYVRGLLTESAEERQKLFMQSARLDAKFNEPAFQLGRIFFQKKEYRQAAQWLQKVAKPASHYHEAVFLLGLCRYYTGDFEGAARSLADVAQAVPLNEVFNDLGAAQSRKNNPEALDNFRKALEGDESDPDYWFNLGLALWKSGRYAEAAKDFRAVLDRTPDDAEAASFFTRAQKNEAFKPGEQPAERIKPSFEETMFLQLQAELKK